MRQSLAMAMAVVVAASAAAQSLRRTPVVQVVERVRPAVVNLTARQVVTVRPRSLFGDLFPEFGATGPEVYTSQSLGSGVLISPDGLIVTNEHVIEGAAEIKVGFSDGKSEQAEVIGSDADSDLAILRVAARGRPFLPLAEKDDSMIGETMIAIGNPLGLGSTVTVGVLSARDRTVTSPDTHRVYTDFLQTDASINPGNSGGALVDLDGRLVGINTAIIGDAQGIGFAIPAKRVRRVVADLLRYGHVQAAWLGMFVANRDERRSGRPRGSRGRRGRGRLSRLAGGDGGPAPRRGGVGRQRPADQRARRLHDAAGPARARRQRDVRSRRARRPAGGDPAGGRAAGRPR